LRCAKPLQATIYKTCNDCRDTAADKRGVASLAQRSLLPTPEATSDRKKRKINDTATVHPLQKKRKFTNTTISTIVRSAMALLESEFEERKAASADFPPNISTAVIRSFIRRYEDMMDTASRLSICGTCGELVLSTDTCTLENDDFRLHVIGQDHLDCCARRGTAWDFCRHCFAALSRSTIPKYSALNRVNVTFMSKLSFSARRTHHSRRVFDCQVPSSGSYLQVETRWLCCICQLLCFKGTYDCYPSPWCLARYSS